MDSNVDNGEIIQTIQAPAKQASGTVFLKKFLSNKYLFSGSVIIIAVVIFAIYGYFFPPYNPSATFASNLQPSSAHLLGTNYFGNDILSDFMAALP